MNCLKSLYYAVLKTVNLLTAKGEKSIFIVPHHNCRTDKYDIINYRSDNALCLFNYLIRQRKFNEYRIALVVDDEHRIEEYLTYVRSINKCIIIDFIPRKKYSYIYIKCFCRSKYIFSTTEFELFPYRIKKQCVSCLSYFTPFKNDFIYTEKKFANMAKRNNKTYDFYFTTSPLSSRIISSDSGLYYSRFRSLGFPRNDTFYQNSNNCKFIECIKKEFYSFSKIITYTPTFRDYESKCNYEKRGLFGFDDKNIPSLIEVLKKHNAVLIAKLHPFQNKDVIDRLNCPNIKLYNSMQNNYSLYDLLSLTDLLITDYTSTVFDFLHTNKPVVFYFYDKQEYEQSRGFAFDPIEFVCPGQITYDVKNLSTVIDYILCGNDDFKEKRYEVSKLMNYYQDGNSARRISDFLF